MEDFQHSRNSSPHSSSTVNVDQLSSGNRLIGGSSPYNEKTGDRQSAKAGDVINDTGAMANVSVINQSPSDSCIAIAVENEASRETSFIGRIDQQDTSDSRAHNVELSVPLSSSKRNGGQIETV